MLRDHPDLDGTHAGLHRPGCLRRIRRLSFAGHLGDRGGRGKRPALRRVSSNPASFLITRHRWYAVHGSVHMASYLWLRGQTWFFQLRPPSDLKPTLGSSPFRVRLPVQSNRVASRYARHLAGWAERWFSAMRYRGFARLRIHSVEGDESWTEEDHRGSQAAIRRQVTDFLLAEVHHQFARRS
jgi:hypothetical protein